MSAASTPATKALSEASVAYRVHTYEHDHRSESYGMEAVGALGVDAGRVFKTLVIELTGAGLAVAVVPVACTLSLKSAAAALGASKAVMADPAKARRITGYVLGGISPLGQRRALPTVIDSSAPTWDTVYCSAGKRGSEIELAPTELIRLTDAVVTEIAVRAG